MKFVQKRLVPTVDVFKLSRTGVVLQSIYLILHLTSRGHLVIACSVVVGMGLKTIILQHGLLQFNSINFFKGSLLHDTIYIQRPPFLKVKKSEQIFEGLIWWVLFGKLGRRLEKIKEKHPLGLVTGNILIRISKWLSFGLQSSHASRIINQNIIANYG